MPIISMFLGIIIQMFTRGEHNPPHFHASYQGHNAVFDLEGELLEGEMPSRQQKFIAAWPCCIRMSFWRTGSWLRRNSRFTRSIL